MNKTNTIILIVVLCVSLCCVVAFYLLKCRHKKSFSMLGGSSATLAIENNTDFYNSIVEQAPQPRALMTDDFSYILNEKSGVWYYTEKTDGERSVIVLNNGKAFKAKFEKITPLNFTVAFKGTCVLDSELYDNKYYIFDIYVKNGMLLYNKPFHERKNYLTEFEDDNLKIKKFLTIEGTRENRERILKDLYKIVINNGIKEISSEKQTNEINWRKVYYQYKKTGRFIKKSELNKNSFETNNKENNSSEIFTSRKIDGVIIQNDKRVKDMIQLKWKRRELTTCDFYLKYIPEKNLFYLYTASKSFVHFRALDDNEPLLITLDNGKAMKPITTPFINEIHIFSPSEENKYDDSQYTEEERETIKTLMLKIIKNPLDYDKKIVEMSYNGCVWLPFRIRNDKIEPNSYRTVSLNLQVIFDYPSFTDSDRVYYESIDEYSEDSQITHTISHAMRDCIFDHIEKRTKSTNVLDLASGRGGDFERFTKLGFKNIFGLDNAHNCAKYIRRAAKTITNEQTLNMILSYISGNEEQNNKIISDIKSRTEYPKNGFDFILMNFAIHYILEIDNGLQQLRKLLDDVSNKNTLFLFTAFDGDQMISEARENNGEINCDTFKIEVDETRHTAKMVLPTISKEPRNEKLFTYEDLTKLGGEVVESFYPFKDRSAFVSASANSKGLIKYYSYMKAFVVLLN